MKRIYAFILAILFCALTACAAAQTSDGPTGGATTVLSADTQTGATSGTPETAVTDDTETPAETPTATVTDEPTGIEEDPIYAETLLTFKSGERTFDVSYGLYRYFYCSYRDHQLSIDPDHYSSQNVETDLLLDADAYAAENCRRLAAYFLLAGDLGVTPEGFDEEFASYLSTLELYAAFSGVTVSEYLGGYLPISALRVLYEANYYIIPAVNEALQDEERGLIDFSDDAVSALAKEYRTVKHILVGYDDGLSDEEALALANELIEKYKNGEDFDQLIENYSNDYHAGTENIYTFTHGEMVPDFEQTAFELEENELSQPVRSTYGYHIILRLPLAGDFAENYYPEAAVTKYVSDYAAGLEVHNSDTYNALTDVKLG